MLEFELLIASGVHLDPALFNRRRLFCNVCFHQAESSVTISSVVQTKKQQYTRAVLKWNTKIHDSYKEQGKYGPTNTQLLGVVIPHMCPTLACY